MSWTGKLTRADFGPGAWVLETSTGRFTLYGEVPSGLRGQKVPVDGQQVGAMGIAMVGGQGIQGGKVGAA